MTTFRTGALKAFIPIVLIVLIIVAALSLIQTQLVDKPHGAAHTEEGAKVPDIHFFQFPDKKINLSSYNAKVVMVNFWATWCAACMIEIPSIIRLREKYHKKGFEVFLINLDENPGPAIQKTAKRFNISFPLYFDKEEKLSELFDVHGLPLTVVLGSDGSSENVWRILYKISGEKDWDSAEVHEKLEHWLSI